MEKKFRNPIPTVDIIIELISDKKTDPDSSISGKKIVLIQRKNPPFGWALPGGFVDYGESLEDAAVREAKEETSLDVVLLRQFHTYSEAGRDPRQHTITTVYIATAKGQPIGKDDAIKAEIFSLDNLPVEMAFDHAQILEDYLNNKY
jgi:ADP-ribose pyrophosphatase YjhB (NUDIX family)